MRIAFVIYGLIWLGLFLIMLWNQKWPSRRDWAGNLNELIVCMFLSACWPALVAMVVAMVALVGVILAAIGLVTIPIVVVALLLSAVKFKIDIRAAMKDRVRMLEDAQRQYDEGNEHGREE